MRSFNLHSFLPIVLIVLGCHTASAQDTTSRADFYLSAGLSISNTDTNSFAYSSYPSLEAGFMKNNFSLGLVLGRSNLDNFRADDISNYWYELKAALYMPVGRFNAYGILGLGNYITTETIFIEYGAGFSYGINHFNVFAQASNWDGFWYVTPGIGYTF